MDASAPPATGRAPRRPRAPPCCAPWSPSSRSAS